MAAELHIWDTVISADNNTLRERRVFLHMLWTTAINNTKLRAKVGLFLLFGSTN